MGSYDHLSMSAIGDVFSQAIGEQGGRVLDAFHDERTLYARAVLPKVEAIRANDEVQGGVALRASEGGIQLHPYLFRIVCTNGAIRTRAFASTFITEPGGLSEAEFAEQFREAVVACCADEVFAEGIDGMRELAGRRVDAFIRIMSGLGRALPAEITIEILRAIVEGDRSSEPLTSYDLLNILTAAARDTRDARQRWDLEELAGRIIDGRVPLAPTAADAADPARAAVRHKIRVG